MSDDNAHIYDGAGICGLCDRCKDPACCEQVPCDRRAWAKVFKLLEERSGVVQR